MKNLNVTKSRFNDLMSSRTKVTTLLCWDVLQLLFRMENETIFLVMSGEISSCFLSDIITLILSKLKNLF